MWSLHFLFLNVYVNLILFCCNLSKRGAVNPGQQTAPFALVAMEVLYGQMLTSWHGSYLTLRTLVECWVFVSSIGKYLSSFESWRWQFFVDESAGGRSCKTGTTGTHAAIRAAVHFWRGLIYDWLFVASRQHSYFLFFFMEHLFIIVLQGPSFQQDGHVHVFQLNFASLVLSIWVFCLHIMKSNWWFPSKYCVILYYSILLKIIILFGILQMKFFAKLGILLNRFINILWRGK